MYPRPVPSSIALESAVDFLSTVLDSPSSKGGAPGSMYPNFLFLPGTGGSTPSLVHLQAMVCKAQVTGG